MSLYEQIADYCAQNKINPTAFSLHVVGDRTFFGRLREIGQDRIRASTLQRCLAFLQANPDGGDCPRIQPRKKPVRSRPAVTGTRIYAKHSRAPHPGFNRADRRIDESTLVRVDRRNCFNCGARDGCAHFPKDSGL